MANVDADKRNWDDDDRFYSSSSPSDDSPILSYRRDKRHYISYTSPPAYADRERRSALSVLSKFCLFCAAMIVFCVLMYIPVYSKANYHIPKKGFVAGWSAHTNRDTKIYVQPNNVTTVHEPKDLCQTNKQKNKLLLLIIVCSSTTNFDRRQTIRETFASYVNYKKHLIIFNKVREQYKNYDFKYSLYPLKKDLQDYNGSKDKGLEKPDNVSVNYNVTYTDNAIREARDISSLRQLLPVLAKALTNISMSKTEKVPEKRVVEEKRFEDEDEGVIPGFDMNKDIERTDNIVDFDYDYDTNIMKIPPKGYEDDSPDLSKVLNLLKQSKDFEKVKENMVATDAENPEFRLVFLLGMPSKENGTIQKKIEEEIDVYNDIIQEDFVDSYNNLTLKSIMMLKYVTMKCNDRFRYILKTDDDTYVNVPNLILHLQNRSRAFDKSYPDNKKEYLLIGDAINGAKPILDADSKWFSPRYMYSGRVYPRYLSGMGYCMSMPTAHALYAAALSTHYFHMEDVFITGMCTLRAIPRIIPQDDPLFSYLPVSDRQPCLAHAQATAHRVTPADMLAIHAVLGVGSEVDRCERIRLTKVRQDAIRRLLKLRKAQANLKDKTNT